MKLKQKIILEALRLFSLKGFLSTSLLDITTAAGCSKGGFYNHFKSKEELFFAVLDQARAIWRDHNLAGLDQVQSPVAKVKKLLSNFRDIYLRDTNCLPGGCIFVTLSVELDDQLPELAREVSRGFEGLKRMIKNLLEQGKLAGELREGTDTDAVTGMIFAGILGITVIFGVDKSPAVLDLTINSLCDYLDRLSPETGLGEASRTDGLTRLSRL
ncbi:MAG: TetR/AcrR family transcriptional regulator [Syntrophobacteraceae bacterium]|nr:TetR/AcrR family transcriptional regulator [Syntrophobacteraceae bacterium]